MIVTRLFDILGALIGIIFLFPFLLFISILIILTSPGSVFYFQTRVG
ncbi:MAG: sugar transferase, partial [Bacteroidia bacterium]|nr:sugar transferase [Bacteroidia bacterium]